MAGWFVPLRMFQSAPGGEAGGNRRPIADAAALAGFNPPPAVRPEHYPHLFRSFTFC